MKSMLSCLHMYFLSLFSLLVSIARRLKRLQRDFLLGGISGEPKLHLVNWKTVCSIVPRGVGCEKSHV